jgi:FixJ family two-component response regulator
MVFVVTADGCVRRPLERLIATTGFDVEGCGTLEELCALHRPSVPCCVLLDVSLGADGLELQRQVALTITAPIVFITGHPDVRVIVQAMRAGAVDVLAEPVNPEQLLGAIRAAIEHSRAALDREAAVRDMREHYASLTPREREVMALVVSGLLNKQVAFELGISEITVKAHRGQVMRKTRAKSLPDLVRIASRLDSARLLSATPLM